MTAGIPRTGEDMSGRHVCKMYRALDAAIQEFEVAQMRGECAHPEPVLDLAQQVVRAVESLPPEAQGRLMMRRKQTAEALIVIYGPEPAHPAPSTETQQRFYNRLLYSMGIF